MFHKSSIFGKNFRSGNSHTPSYAYGDAHKCNKPCNCSACCCDKKKDILCDLLQIFLMMIIMDLVISAILQSPPCIGPRMRRRRRRSLEMFQNSFQILPNPDKLKHILLLSYRVVLGHVTNFVRDNSSIGEIASDTPWNTNPVSYEWDAYRREPRNWILFGDDDNNLSKPDLCKKKCCIKCCKKDKILCIIQVILLVIIMILLMIVNFLLTILDPCPFRRKRRRRSVSKQQPFWLYSTDNITSHDLYFEHYEPAHDRGTNDMNDARNIDEVVKNIHDALSSIVRTRDVSIDLRHVQSKCHTCIQWSVFDVGYEYGPFVTHSAIPKMLQPLIF